jgi:hypothetical protein
VSSNLGIDKKVLLFLLLVAKLKSNIVFLLLFLLPACFLHACSYLGMNVCLLKMVVHLLNNVFLLAFFASSRAAVPSHMFLFYTVLVLAWIWCRFKDSNCQDICLMGLSIVPLYMRF